MIEIIIITYFAIATVICVSTAIFEHSVEKHNYSTSLGVGVIVGIAWPIFAIVMLWDMIKDAFSYFTGKKIKPKKELVKKLREKVNRFELMDI